MKDRQHVQEMDKQMDHMCYWHGARIPQAAMKLVHPLLKQTDTVSEPPSQLVQPAKNVRSATRCRRKQGAAVKSTT